MVFPQQYWTSSKKLMMSLHTVLNILHSTNGIPPKHWTSSTVLDGVPPQYWWYPPQYWTPSTLLNTLHSTTQKFPSRKVLLSNMMKYSRLDPSQKVTAVRGAALKEIQGQTKVDTFWSVQYFRMTRQIWNSEKLKWVEIICAKEMTRVRFTARTSDFVS